MSGLPSLPAVAVLGTDVLTWSDCPENWKLLMCKSIAWSLCGKYFSKAMHVRVTTGATKLNHY